MKTSPVPPPAQWRAARRIQDERPRINYSPATVIAMLCGFGFTVLLGIIVAHYLL